MSLPDTNDRDQQLVF